MYPSHVFSSSYSLSSPPYSSFALSACGRRRGYPVMRDLCACVSLHNKQVLLDQATFMISLSSIRALLRRGGQCSGSTFFPRQVYRTVWFLPCIAIPLASCWHLSYSFQPVKQYLLDKHQKVATFYPQQRNEFLEDVKIQVPSAQHGIVDSLQIYTANHFCKKLSF